MKEFRIYDLNELNELAQATEPTRISLILDEGAVDFLLSLRQGEEDIDDDEVDELAESIEDDVLQTVGEMSVASERLSDGLKRLLAIQNLGYPEGLCATVVFGAELGASSVVQLTRKGVPESDCGPRCAYYLRWLKKAVQNGTVREIRVFWGGDLYGSGDVALDEDVYAVLDKPTWCFETNMPVTAFSMYDTYEGDREHFCRGIVLDLDQWFPARNYTQTVMCQGGCES